MWLSGAGKGPWSLLVRRSGEANGLAEVRGAAEAKGLGGLEKGNVVGIAEAIAVD